MRATVSGGYPVGTSAGCWIKSRPKMMNLMSTVLMFERIYVVSPVLEFFVIRVSPL